MSVLSKACDMQSVKIHWIAPLLVSAGLLLAGDGLQAEPAGASVRALDARGELLVSIVTHGNPSVPLEAEGMQLLADTVHKHGLPVTWLLRPFQAAEAADRLKQWHEQYGDEVGWYCEATMLHEAEAEFKALKRATPWQTSIVSVGKVSYNKNWVDLWQRLGIAAVWGRCYEQSDCDGISDRGSPHGFYYLRPSNYKAPNDGAGGLISVPWLSNDPNLIFWTGVQSQLTFDPDDLLDFGFVEPGRYEAWYRLVDEFQKQTRFNKVVPLIVQQEYNAPSLKITVPSMDALFAYLKEKGIKVVPLREAVRQYNAAAGDSTPPTYGVYNNLGSLDIIRNPSSTRNFTFEMVRTPIRESDRGATFNGIYATHRVYHPLRKQLYYSPDGKKYYEHGRLFTYYDRNGLLLFDENNPQPKRITSYLELPPDLHGFSVLPELSFVYDTDKFIPKVTLHKEEVSGQVKIQIAIEPFRANPAAAKRLPYGVMVWGDFRAYRLPAGMPEGTAIVGDQGLFVPFVLQADQPVTRDITLSKAELVPPATLGEPAEPEQLRGLPRPNELPLAQGSFQPTKASLDEHYQCPEWFADAKFGFWAHWGPQCVGMNGWYAKRLYDPTFPVNLYEQHIKRFGHPSKFGYKDIIPLFKAEKFDPDGLMAEFKQMGARLFLAMGVHHDNYDMWDSKYHRWNAMKIGPHKDIVALWQQAAKKQGLRFGVSEHLAPSYDWWNPNKSSDKTGPLAGVPYDGVEPANWDLYHPPHPGDQDMQAGFGAEINKYPEWFKEHWYRRTYDLVTTYKPDFVDSDDFGLPFGDAYASKLAAHYYNRSAASHGGKPDAVWCGRGGNGKGVIAYSEFGLPNLIWRYPWVQGTTISDWFWGGENQAPRMDTLVKTLVEVICRNGNFIISFPQRADGTVPDAHMACLREMGKWVRLNEEGIFETRPWRMLGEGPTTTPYNRYERKEPYFKKEDIRFTRKAGVIYAFLMNPADDKVLIHSLGKRARLVDGVPQNVRLIGCEEKLNWSQEEEGLKVQLPQAWVGRTVPVLEIRGLAAWDGDIRPVMDGQLVLDVNDSQLHGQKLQQVFGRYFTENWSDPAEWISWEKPRIFDAGEYEVNIYGGGLRDDVPYKLMIGEKELTGKAPNSGGWSKGVIFSPGKVIIKKAGVYPVSLHAGSDKNWAGLQVFNITLKCVQYR